MLDEADHAADDTAQQTGDENGDEDVDAHMNKVRTASGYDAGRGLRNSTVHSIRH